MDGDKLIDCYGDAPDGVGGIEARLAREAQLLQAAWHGFKDAAADSLGDNTGSTLFKAGSAVAIGGLCSLLQENPKVGWVAAKAGTFVFGTTFVADLSTGFGQVCHAISDAWSTDTNMTANRALMAHTIGNFAFDTAITLPAAIGGAVGGAMLRSIDVGQLLSRARAGMDRFTVPGNRLALHGASISVADSYGISPLRSTSVFMDGIAKGPLDTPVKPAVSEVHEEAEDPLLEIKRELKDGTVYFQIPFSDVIGEHRVVGFQSRQQASHVADAAVKVLESNQEFMGQPYVIGVDHRSAPWLYLDGRPVYLPGFDLMLDNDDTFSAVLVLKPDGTPSGLHRLRFDKAGGIAQEQPHNTTQLVDGTHLNYGPRYWPVTVSVPDKVKIQEWTTHTEIRHPDGIRVEEWKEGSWKYPFKQTTMPNGDSITEELDEEGERQVTCYRATDKLTEIEYPGAGARPEDIVRKRILPDGTEQWYSQNGKRYTWNTDGTTVTSYPAGDQYSDTYDAELHEVHKVFSKDFQVIVSEDGNHRCRLPDGSEIKFTPPAGWKVDSPGAESVTDGIWRVAQPDGSVYYQLQNGIICKFTPPGKWTVQRQQ